MARFLDSMLETRQHYRILVSSRSRLPLLEFDHHYRVLFRRIPAGYYEIHALPGSGDVEFDRNVRICRDFRFL